MGQQAPEIQPQVLEEPHKFQVPSLWDKWREAPIVTQQLASVADIIIAPWFSFQSQQQALRTVCEALTHSRWSDFRPFMIQFQH